MLFNSGYPNDLTIQIQMGGVSFEAYHDLDEPSEGIITIPFTEFVPAPWENKPEVIVDQEKLKNVTQFALYTGGEQGEGTLYFDDMRAVYDEAQPEVPNAEETPSPEEPTEDNDKIDNKESFTKKDNSYQFDLTTEQIEITKDVITQLEKNATIQLNYQNTTVTIPVQLLQSYKENITFAFLPVSDKIKEKRGDVLSDLFDFQLFAGEQEITEFEQPLTITFALDNDQEYAADNLQVILVDQDGELVTDQRFDVVWDEETKSASTDLTHFSIYGVFAYTEETPEESKEDPSSDPEQGNQAPDDDSNESSSNDGDSTDQKQETENNSGANHTDSNSDQSESLPDTATNTANWLVTGLLLTLSGIVALVMARRKSSINK
jgi:mannan endo-1,4-beta-mannosidase